MKIYKVRITDKAEAEYKEAYFYYESKQLNLGLKFELETDALIRIIVKKPFLFPRKYKQHREALMKRFPYFIVYEIVQDSIILHSFFHTSRHPGGKILRGRI